MRHFASRIVSHGLAFFRACIVSHFLALPLHSLTLPIAVMVAVTLAATFGVGVAYGQNGSRLLQKVDAPEGMPADDDRHWKLGVFYWSGEDASLFVPNRFGIGWGMNLGRPAAWAIIAAFVLIVAALVIFSVTL